MTSPHARRTLCPGPDDQEDAVLRSVCARRVVQDPPDLLAEELLRHPAELLQAATETAPDGVDDDGSFEIHLRGELAGIPVSKAARAHIGEARQSSERLIVPLRWTADPVPRAFASFDGAMELEVLDAQHGQLSLVGVYDPPMGTLGALGDQTVLDTLARGTTEWLLARLAATLHERMVTHGPPPTPRAGNALVGEVMTVEPLAMTEDTSLRAAAGLLLRAGIGGAPVVDADRRLVGLVTVAHLLDEVGILPRERPGRTDRGAPGWSAPTVGDVCDRPAPTTTTTTTVRRVARRMAATGTDRMVVMDGAEVVGLVSRTDLVKVMVREDAELLAMCRTAVWEMGQAGIDIDVFCGTVRLAGLIARPATLRQVVDRIAEIDGVAGVDAADLAGPLPA